MTTVRGKTVIITGGANGIGFQTCQQLLLHGAKVVLAVQSGKLDLNVILAMDFKDFLVVAILDLPTSNGEASVKKLTQEFGEGRALFFPLDVTNFDEFDAVFKKAVTAIQGLDILINNAGIANDKTWQKMIDINFTAVVKSTLLGYDYMGKHKGGKGGVIVNVASILGLVPSYELPVYAGTKHAVLGFSRSLKPQYEKTGVSMRIMCPGITDTPLISEAGNKSLSFVDSDTAAKPLLSRPRQPAEYVAKSMIQLIEEGQNGSAWVSQNKEPPFEVNIDKYESIKIH